MSNLNRAGRMRWRDAAGERVSVPVGTTAWTDREVLEDYLEAQGYGLDGTEDLEDLRAEARAVYLGSAR